LDVPPDEKTCGHASNKNITTTTTTTTIRKNDLVLILIYLYNIGENADFDIMLTILTHT
jgi:hypothetical protein